MHLKNIIETYASDVFFWRYVQSEFEFDVQSEFEFDERFENYITF